MSAVLSSNGAPPPPPQGLLSGATTTLDQAFSRLACEAPKPKDPGPLLAPGERIAGTPYVVIRALGRGGMGEVYEVRDDTGARWALKLLHRAHAHRADLALRMRLEARLAARIDHPHVVRIHFAGEAEGRPYLVMELLRGRDLHDVMACSGALPVPLALRLIADALDGLAAAHDAGVIHRDVKLENLFLCEDGRVKVVDFGVAKALSGDLSTTAPGVSIGTPRSMAPEQHAFSRIDPRADLYAVGLVLYELCAGRGPFDDLRGQPQAMRFAHCERDPLPPSRLARQPIDPRVDAIVLRALAKSPADRFQSAREMAAALRSILAGPSPSLPSPPLPALARRRAWPPAVLPAIAMALFALGLALGRASAGSSHPARAAPVIAPIR